jgi:hypothetical protein
MKHRSKAILPPRLLGASRVFEQWRSQQKTRRRLPDHLWSLASELARLYGVSITAKTLRLGYSTLKTKSLRVTEKDSKGQLNATATEFLELRPAGLPMPVECTIECQHTNGSRIQVHLKGSSWPDLPELCEGLLGTNR